MSRKRQSSARPEQPRRPQEDAAASQTGDASGVSVGDWHDRARRVRRAFPGPRAVEVPLRVAMERAAYADVTAHAKESLDAEICGVLAGSICEDDDGAFVHVAAAVRGAKAKEGSAHVTYTQETWNAVHATIERDFPKLQIVGWYHSHPGFGVEFSDMDRFIQGNFFAGPCQIGLVTDPLGGEVAICVNVGGGDIEYLGRFWVDGREQRCRVPHHSSASAAGAAAGAPVENLDAIERRLAQLVQAVDELRGSLYRWLTVLGMATAVLAVFMIARAVLQMAFGELPELPKNVGFASIPVTVDGKSCLLGVQVVKWKIPPELLVVPPEMLEPREPEKKATEAQSEGADAAPKKSSPPENAPARRAVDP